MTLAKGTLEIIALADGKEPKSFGDFSNISIGKKKLSTATVSKRVKDLVAISVLEEVIMRSPTGRKIVGYKTTERGKKILDIARELQMAIQQSKRKNITI